MHARTLTTVLTLVVLAVGAAPAGSMTAAPQALRATKTTVGCEPDVLFQSSQSTCVVRVTDAASGKKSPPAGTVSFTSTAPRGVFEPASCTLETSGTAVATCTTTYRPVAIGNGSHLVTASYGGSETHTPTTGRYEIGVTPVNNNRRNAAKLRPPPSAIEGTTIGATTDYSDPQTPCGGMRATVWYSLAARSTERVAVRLRARGRLDAIVAVFRLVRSEYRPLGCVPTDDKGVGGIAFEAERRGRYFIVVGERGNSASSTFRLELFAPPLAELPGPRLPSGGANSSVDPLTRPEAAWSIGLAAGRTYRINLAPDRGRCLSLSLFAPGTSSFTREYPVRSRACGGYFVVTPGPDDGGRYSLLVRSQGNRGGTQRYHLHVARAGKDDIAPGLPIRSGQTRRGSLSGRSVDVLDLYRFEVTHVTEITARLQVSRTMPFELLLLSGEGGQLDCVCGTPRVRELRAQLDEGEYFLAVRARAQSVGRYRVSLLIREITSTLALIDGVEEATSELGRTVTLTARLTPSAAVGGLVRFRVDRFDPIEGWQFSRMLGARVSGGDAASVSWRPPTVGRWRVRAFYMGTRAASPSASRHVSLRVEG
jgi:hypothetical protein